MELVKLSIFVKTTTTVVNDKMTIAFSSPVHFNLLLHNILNWKLVLLQSHHCFEQLLKKMVLHNTPKVMQDTTPPRLVPLKCHWQDKVSWSFQKISKKVLKRSVGQEFNQWAFLNLYIKDGLHWGIELIRDGDGKQLEEHVVTERVRLWEKGIGGWVSGGADPEVCGEERGFNLCVVPSSYTVL